MEGLRGWNPPSHQALGFFYHLSNTKILAMTGSHNTTLLAIHDKCIFKQNTCTERELLRKKFGFF